MASFNTFNIKRQAHNLSRTSSDQTWNLFRHVSWDRRPNTSKKTPWEAAEGLESHRNMPGDGDALTHISTEPSHRARRSHGWSHEDDITELREYNKSSSRDTDELSRGAAGHPPDTAASQRSLVGNGAASGTGGAEGDLERGLRHRKTDEKDDDTRGIGSGAGNGDDANGKEKKKKKEHGFLRHVEPKEPFTVANQLQRTFLSSWINILLIAAPVGIALNYIHSVNRIAVFVVNFIAIIPLAAILGFATEEIALRTGEVLGGLINATFGNAVELIVAILALVDGKTVIVQTSLIGSILSNLLLVMGFCFFFGGLRRQQQYFNETVAQTAASLLALAAASVIVPTVFDQAAGTPVEDVAALSRGTSVILLIVYAAYLLFQLKTHHTIFAEEGQKVEAKPWKRGSLSDGAIKQGLAAPGVLVGHGAGHGIGNGVTDENEQERLSRMLMNPQFVQEEEEEEEPQLHFAVAVATLAFSTVFIALCAEFMVDSIDAVTKNGGVSEEFVGLILLPIVGNAAEHATAVSVAIKDKMDLAIGVAVGSSMQVALFLLPLLVVIGWGMGEDKMNLSMDFFQVAVMFVAVLLTNYLIADGKSHWLEGFLLICLYAIIAVCSWFYPDSETQASSSS